MPQTTIAASSPKEWAITMSGFAPHSQYCIAIAVPYMKMKSCSSMLPRALPRERISLTEGAPPPVSRSCARSMYSRNVGMDAQRYSIGTGPDEP